MAQNYSAQRGIKDMSSKTSADVIIGGKVYTLSGYESEAYLQKVALYLNNKMNELEVLEDYRRLSADMRATLLELNVADDYFKVKEQAEKLEEDLDARNKEIYDLKHELVSAQLKLETLENSLEESEKENKELLLTKTKLEAELEDLLLAEPVKKT
jgi:cell division protein ZapA